LRRGRKKTPEPSSCSSNGGESTSIPLSEENRGLKGGKSYSLYGLCRRVPQHGGRTKREASKREISICTCLGEENKEKMNYWASRWARRSKASLSRRSHKREDFIILEFKILEVKGPMTGGGRRGKVKPIAVNSKEGKKLGAKGEDVGARFVRQSQINRVAKVSKKRGRSSAFLSTG